MSYITKIKKGCESLGWDFEYDKKGDVEKIKIKPYANVKFYYNGEPAVQALIEAGKDRGEAENIVFEILKFEGCYHYNTQIFWVEFSEKS